MHSFGYRVPQLPHMTTACIGLINVPLGLCDQDEEGPMSQSHVPGHFKLHSLHVVTF